MDTPNAKGLFLTLKKHLRGTSNDIANSIISRADAARDAKRYRDAAILYEEALRLVPERADIHLQCGHMFKEAGELAAAEAHYDEARRQMPKDPEIVLQFGHFYKVAGRLREAEISYEDALILRPGWAEASRELAAIRLMRDHSVLANGNTRPPNTLPPAKALFPGSTFPELSISSVEECAKAMAKSATPAAQLARSGDGKYSPQISVILPIYNTPAGFFREVTQSVFAQTYTKWEMCIVDDGSRLEETIAIRQELERAPDPRIKVITFAENKGIAQASHAALMAATGDYVAFIDHDDLITPNALSEVVALLRERPTIDYVYTDHAMTDRDGLPKSLAYKPEWSPEFLLSTNYIVHFKVVRRTLLLSVGGLAHEVSHAQDLGMTWRLVEANAHIAHLPKAVYLWREHENSVASTSEAKPGIEKLLCQVYDRHLSRTGAPASQTWPQLFKQNRIGAFKLNFKKVSAPISLVVLMKSDQEATADIRARVGRSISKNLDIQFVSLGKHGIKASDVAVLVDDTEIDQFLSSLGSEYVAFVNSTARFIASDWLDNLLGYLALDERIGAVGGKVLDQFLRVRAGGLLVDQFGNYDTICGGQYDNCPGPWFIGQAASDVDAVSSQLVASRVKTLLSNGGVQFRDYEDAWSMPFCLHLRENDFRVVYNPFSKVFDPFDPILSSRARDRISAIGQSALAKRYYRVR